MEITFDMYHYSASWSDEDAAFIGRVSEWPGLKAHGGTEEKAIKEIPSIVHVDNTCRIQTLKEKDNKPYYDLIKCFYEKTNMPMLLNTSFNLAGYPIVENNTFLEFTVKNSEFKYIYKP